MDCWKFVSIFLVSFCVLVNGIKVDDKDYMRQQLDDMQEHFDGKGAKYNQAYYDKLTSCLNKFNDTLLLKAQNSMWKG